MACPGEGKKEKLDNRLLDGETQAGRTRGRPEGMHWKRGGRKVKAAKNAAG